MLSTRQQKAIDALLIAPTRTAAARLAGVGDSTLRTYMKNDEFVNAYNAARREQLREAAQGLQARLNDAVNTMGTICTDESTPAQVRLNAAQAVITNTLKLVETVDILSSIEELEQWRAENDGKH
jgi:hypothetical protein